jgi:phosphopantothenoylcysteine decarboxylase/phosphopantothenate--cysteine ligase
MLNGKKILVGVTGSIAAYKIATLVRLLVKAGAEVKVIMTASAAGFISPLTLSTLSKNEVQYQLSDNNSWANHVILGRWADLMLIAPLSCNTLSKMATGACDNLLMAVYLSATCPVVVAPAMDEDMWHHPSTKRNITTVESYGNHVIPVNNGELASGLSGDGRMAEPEQMLQWIQDFFFEGTALFGKKVLITAGPTHEPIDPVRFIGNASSGKMGVALAAELKKRGAAVTLVLGPSSQPVPPGINVIHVRSAKQMYDACMEKFEECNWAIMSAAVADYRPAAPAVQKIKKKEDAFQLELVKTEDILKKLGTIKKEDQCLIGFALETNNEKENALKKLQAKNADLIVLNSLNDAGAGFGYDSNKITIFDKKGGEYHFETKSKSAVAADIINTIISYCHE